MSTKARQREDLIRTARDLAYTGKYRSYKSIELELRSERKLPRQVDNSKVETLTF